MFLIFFVLSLFSKETLTGHFLNVIPCPYPTSLSNAFTSHVNSDSVFYNPAGIGLLTYSVASIARHQYFENITHDYLNLTIDSKYGNLSMFYSILRSGEITAYDLNENIIGNTSTSHSLYGITYAKGFPYFEYAKGKIDPMLIPPYWSGIKPVKIYIPKVYRFSIGLTLKRIEDRLADVKKGINLVDVGALLVLPNHLQLGLSIQNITHKRKFYELEEKIPITFRIGVAKNFATIKDIMNFTFSSDYVIIESDRKFLNSGMEINISKSFQIRVGYTTNDTSFSNFVAGIGLTFDKFLSKESIIRGLRMDYTYLGHKYLDTTHRLGFQMIW